MSKANSKKRNILPDPEELMKLKRKRTETEHAFDECCRKVRSYELDAASTFCKRNEDQCIAWLILKYGFNVVTTVARIHTALPASLTQHQRLRMIEILSGNIASHDVISDILSFAERACPTLFEIVVPTPLCWCWLPLLESVVSVVRGWFNTTTARPSFTLLLE